MCYEQKNNYSLHKMLLLNHPSRTINIHMYRLSQYQNYFLCKIFIVGHCKQQRLQVNTSLKEF